MVALISTDPCPLPVSWMLGDKDYKHYGWYSLLINVSDIAAMGGHVKGIVLATVMSPEMPFKDYERFLKGVKEASKRV